MPLLFTFCITEQHFYLLYYLRILFSEAYWFIRDTLSIFQPCILLLSKQKSNQTKLNRKERHLRLLHFRREIELNSTKTNGHRVSMGELSAICFCHIDFILRIKGGGDNFLQLYERSCFYFFKKYPQTPPQRLRDTIFLDDYVLKNGSQNLDEVIVFL